MLDHLETTVAGLVFSRWPVVEKAMKSGERRLSHLDNVASTLLEHLIASTP